MTKTTTKTQTCGRNRELGAVAIVVGMLWLTLFGLAAFAIDIGYGYTNRRSVKAVADAALRAAMPDYNSGSTSAASTKALAVMHSNGYDNGVNGVVASAVEAPASSPAPTRFKVTLSVPQPSFFLKLFGIAIGNVDVLSSGVRGASGGPAIYSNDTSLPCGTQWDNSKGIDVAGGGLFRVNGNIESENKIHIGNPSGLCNGVNCQITGAVRTTACSFFNDAGTSVVGVGSAVTGATLTNPIPAYATLAALCTQGNLTSPLGAIPCNPDVTCLGGCRIPNDIYCSNAAINIAPGAGMSICTTGATFITPSTITITGAGNITLNPHPNSGGMVAYSNYSGGGPAIQLSNGPAFAYTVNGSVFAPQGLLNVGTGTPGFTMTGTLGGKVVNISTGPGQPWTFNAPGGGSGGTWTAYE